MKLSQTFVKTFKTISKEESAKSAQLLIRAGYINKQMAGVYGYLPLGLRVLKNIENIIREEMNALGAQEIQLTALQNPEPWQKTDRWSDKVMDVWFKTDLAAGGQLGLAPTHEEPLTHMMTSYIESYKDLPCSIYQFQTKFRNELRAKSGILRTREFLMKDLYSFAPDKETHEKIYADAEKAYHKIYACLGIGDDTFQTFASGGAFSKFSHEFQTITPVGEDTIYFNEDKSVVLNEEVLQDDILKDLGVTREELTSAPAAEVGNIFTLGTKYSEPLGLTYADKDGSKKPVFMGCYGIGVSRVMGVIAEKFADDKGLVWPENIAPYIYYIVPIGDQAAKISAELEAKSPDTILLDDRDLRPGAKFADAELMGIPYRLVISDKTLANNQVEQTTRATGETQLVDLSKF